MIGLGERLKRAREAKGLGQKEVAKLTGINYKTISNYETDRSEPDVQKLATLCTTYGIPVDELICTGTSAQAGADIIEHRGIIRKYAALDGHGKQIVSLVLDEETRRIQQTQLHLVTEPAEPKIIEIEDLYHSVQKVSAGGGVVLNERNSFEHWKVLSNTYTRKADFCVTVTGKSMEPKYHDGDVLLVREQDDIDFGEIGIFIVDDLGYVKQKGENRLISLNPDVEDIYFDEYANFHCDGLVIGTLDPDWVVET